MSSRTWTRAEIVALIESAEVNTLHQPGVAPRQKLRVPAAEKTSEGGADRFPGTTTAIPVPGPSPVGGSEGGAGTTSDAACTCAHYHDGTPAPNPFCKASEHPGRGRGKPEPAADADDLRFLDEIWWERFPNGMTPTVLRTSVRAYGDRRVAAERDKAPTPAHAAAADADDEALRIARWCLMSGVPPLLADVIAAAAAIRAFGQAERERSLREALELADAYGTLMESRECCVVAQRIRALLGGGK